MNKASSLYKELTQDELNSIMKNSISHHNEFEYSLLKGGLYNTTYMVTDKTSNTKYVLRIGPTNEHLVMPFEYNMMNAEKQAYVLCKEHNIPVSNVVVCNTDRDIIDREFMIVDYIDSTAMLNLQLDEVIKSKLYEDVGRYTKKMHNITNSKFGRLSRILVGESFDSWGDYLVSEMTQWALKADKYNHLLMPTNELSAVAEKIKAHKNLLNEITVPSFVHTDIWEGNILVSQTNSNYTVAAIIDADRALFGDSEFDLASGWMITDSFLKGYGNQLNMSASAVTRREIYKFCLDCFDAYALKVEYNNETDGNEKIKVIREFISK